MGAQSDRVANTPRADASTAPGGPPADARAAKAPASADEGWLGRGSMLAKNPAELDFAIKR